MGKGIKSILFIIGIFLLVLAVFNYRYPFVSPESNGWSIGFRTTDAPLQKIFPSESNLISHDSLNRITSSSTRFLADPFLFYEDGIYYLFFEHQEEGPAKIALFQSPDGLNYSYKGNVIDESFHLSFPQIFKYKQDYYILPESAAINQVVLYKAVNFPLEWKVSDTLIKNIKLKDPAILMSDTINLITGIDEDWEQHIFRADSLFGKWDEDKVFKKRKGNEIRAGGNFFSVKGEWFIPFQNNKEGYGTGVSLYNLREKKFEKVLSNQLYKSDSIRWFGRGMHHLNMNKINDEYYVVYDGDEIKTGKKNLTWKSSIKYNLYDLYNFVLR
ncbi:hypothetical protein [Gramella sp. MAR_2010_147]|uniref:glucosamine inositolphosphorylceramide transferase family protein n=1 Tax=Gramella sp. MAR_2010_147 TaxID=1250205 RepID=UPI00087B4001|nr:hypothetical protein [Gramella sp. MAR_2010_147]SDS01014.1 hypothetical protein SAMN04488553_1254 [Gramella sp. MAR_2010_147]